MRVVALYSPVRTRESNQTSKQGAFSFAPRIIAFLLLSLMTFMVVNPIFECQDHLDNLRHLGPHGVLVILLVVALAGVSLLKSVRSLLVCFISSIAICLEAVAVLRPTLAHFAFSLAPESGPPLRI